MFPVLFSIGNLTVSSFGFFLAAAFLLGVFLVWRLARAWDLDEEKVLDLMLLTLLGGLIGARVYFVTTHLDFFAADFWRIFFIPKYPGFSFWGGFLGGWLSLFLFARRFKMGFWHIADMAAIGFLGGLVLSDLGCFFGGCLAGNPSNLFFAVSMVGLVGKRFPVQVLESLLLLVVLLKLWSQATHFHPRGKIVSTALIYIGIIKLLAGFFRPPDASDLIFPITLIVLGTAIFYQTVNNGDSKKKRTLLSDLKAVLFFTAGLFTRKENRNLLLLTLGKSWYNQTADLKWKLANLRKLLRRFRVKPTRKNN